MKLTDKDIARFLPKVKKLGQDDCWEWQASTDSNGYGQLRLNGTTVQSNRIAFFIEHGFIDDSLEVCHTCDNPPCCNPKHLFQGTHADNVRDMMNKGRQNFQVHPELRARGDRHGSHTHPEKWARGEAHVLSKLTSKQVKEIRALHKQGVFQRAIAKMFGISKTQVARIEKGESWKGS